MEGLDIARRQCHRRDRFGGQFGAGAGRISCHRDALWRRVIDALRLLDQPIPAARTDIVDDGCDGVEQRRILASPRPRQRLATTRYIAPVEPLHHSIIFSIGITRIADAPAPFNFSSVSQNTDSWHTAWTA